MISNEATTFPIQGKRTSRSKHVPQSWTASRCNRLLRPLVAKLNVLRKDKLDNQTDEKFSNHFDNGNWSRVVDRGEPRQRDSEEHDALQPRVKITRRYGERRARNRKGNIQKQAKMASPGLSLGTALTAQDQADMRLALDTGSEACSDLEEEMMATSKDQIIWKTVSGDWSHSRSGALDAFFTLLHATRASPIERIGSGSLLSICLRCVPKHILEEKAWRLDRDRDDKTDVAAETYGMLEEYGSTSTEGWTELRQAVRAHGILLMEHAITDRLLETHDIALVMTRCEALGDADAKNRIKEAFQASQHPLSPAGAFLRTREGLYKYTTVPGIHFLRHRSQCSLDLRCRRLTDAVISRTIPFAHLHSSPAAEIWKCTLHATAVQSPNETVAAQNLLETVLLCAAGVNPLMKDKLLRNFQRDRKAHVQLLTLHISDHAHGRIPKTNEDLYMAQRVILATCSHILGAAVLKGLETQSASLENWPATRRVVRSASLGIIHAYSHPDLRCAALRSGHATSAALVLLTDALLSILNTLERTLTERKGFVKERLSFVTTLLIGRNSTQQVALSISLLARLIADVSYSLQLRIGELGFELIKVMCKCLMSYRSSNAEEESLVGRIAFEAIMTFSQKTGRSEHIDYATEVETRVTGSENHHVSQSVRKNRTQAPLRWDDGLCEWVKATPLPLSKLMPLKEQPAMGCKQNLLEAFSESPLKARASGRTFCSSNDGQSRKRKASDAFDMEFDDEEDELSIPSSSQPTLFKSKERRDTSPSTQTLPPGVMRTPVKPSKDGGGTKRKNNKPCVGSTTYSDVDEDEDELCAAQPPV